ncbi:MAG: MFS transporter [Pseudobutyrivibrio sp.]|nr:MFS transporter [Pseudobutyrivibrio sp.]
MSKSDVSKYYGENGVHRVPLWRIGGFALNNTATNFYLFMMNFVAYYLTGFVGVLVVTASSFSMFMRIWDGVTDPFIGYVVDKTNGKFGKNRPFMVIGNVILCVTSFILFHVTHLLPESTPIRFGFFIVVAALYYIGYTFQCVVTKSAQTCLTNDPKQRPLFSVFDAVYNTILFTVMAIVAANLGTKYGSMSDTGVFHELWLLTAICSAIFTVIAVISIAPKDRTEFFGTGKVVRVGLKDYWDTLKNNRAIQMLIVSASTDKLATSAKTSTVTLVLFAVLAGNYSLQGSLTGIISFISLPIMIVLISSLATKLGQRKAMLIGSIGGIFVNLALILLWLIGDPTTMSSASGGIAWGAFTIIYVILNIMLSSFQGISGNIVIPMTADCADYEVYRSGKYVPGLMGTLFSLVDKLVSSFAPMIAGLMYAAIGFKTALPDIDTPRSDELLYVTLFLSYGIVIIGLLCNLVALKFYPLTKEKMEEIQDEIAAIKAKYTAENS